MDEETLQKVYSWVDEVPLSRTRRNITRDFSDGVLMAEVICHYYPQYVELHNYSAANSFTKKIYNWQTLNKKVLKRFGMEVSKEDMEAAASMKPGCVEKLLAELQSKMAYYRSKKMDNSSRSPKDELEESKREYESSRGGSSATSNNARHQNKEGRDDHRKRERDRDRDRDREKESSSEYYDPSISYSSRNGSSPRGLKPSNLSYSGYPTSVGDANVMSSSKNSTVDIITEKNQTIQELHETVEILELKVKKLEQLLNLKDSKISSLSAKLQYLTNNSSNS